MITFLELKNSLKERNTSAFCLFGNDRWVKLKAVRDIMKTRDITDDVFGVEKLDAPSVARLEEACGTFSLFGGRKMVLCENFAFPSGKQCADVVAALTRIVNAVSGEAKNDLFGESFPVDVVLVFLADSSANFDKTPMETVNCNRLDSSAVVSWIVAFGKRRGVAINRLCAQKICDYCLADMSRVETETQKLIDYGEVSEQSIELLVHKDVQFVVYDLSKYVSRRNAQAALDVYRRLVVSGEEPVALFGLIYNFYRRAYYAKISDVSPEELAENLAVQPGAVRFAKETASRYKPMQLKVILDCFSEADRKMKSFADPDEVMVSLILRLACI